MSKTRSYIPKYFANNAQNTRIRSLPYFELSTVYLLTLRERKKSASLSRLIYRAHSYFNLTRSSYPITMKRT